MRIICTVWASLSATAGGADVMPEEWVTQTLENTRAPAVTIGIAHVDQVEIASGGLRSANDTVTATDDDLWHIGSLTKSMSATLVARLVGAGEIAWDDTVQTVLGDVVPGIDPAFSDVTYRDLLSHRSGLVANISRLGALRMSGRLEERDMIADRLTYAASVLSTEPAEPFGTFLYSNAGYVVLGAMLQQSTGQTWEALIKAHVFDPLGMTSADFGPPGNPGVVDQPRGHQGMLWLKAMEPGPAADNIPALGPAGTVHLSVADMLTYLQAHGRRDPSFLQADSWDLLHRPQGDGDYAMGWRVTPEGWLMHNGSNTLWYATAGIDPARDRVAFAASNFAGRGAADEAIKQAVAEALTD